MDQGSQDSDSLKCSRVPDLSNLMEGFTELRKAIILIVMISYTKKILAKIRQGKGITRQWLRITRYDFLLVRLLWSFVDRPHFFSNKIWKHVRSIAHKGSSPRFCGAELWQGLDHMHMDNHLLHPADLSLQTLQRLSSSVSKALAMSHVINIDNSHVPRPPGKQSHSCWGRDIPRA